MDKYDANNTIKPNKYNITVLMSVYNGEKYIREQIDSILRQKEVNVHLIIRDDCSQDNTLNILKEYQNRYNCIELIEANENLGACKSFFRLMSMEFDSEYYALSDQDDIWDDDKLITAISMLDQEKEMNKNLPMLYFSNMRVVDKDNNFIRNNHDWSRGNQSKYSFITEVLATGCTIVYNKALSRIAIEKKPNIFSMHDAWLYSVASLFGKVIYDDTPHINYRQHENNVIGTRKKRFGIETIKRELRRYFNLSYQPRYDNALILKGEFEQELDEEQKEKLNKMLHYKDSFKNRIALLVDKDLYTKNAYLTFRSRIKIILGDL